MGGINGVTSGVGGINECPQEWVDIIESSGKEVGLIKGPQERV